MSFADDLENLFKKLSEHWADLIRLIYKNKGLPDAKIYEPIVKEQAQAFCNALETSLNSVDWDTPDYKLLDFLKKNVWEFSGAKNYNDNIALNNLLLDANGNLRPWHDFKREAQKVVGNSVRYLKTEYNTIVLGGQNARLWLDIQRTKHLFPFLQFDVVLDGHTSEICKPLDKVIVSVDDPMLKHYFPPNHFNCRTTVRKLRNAKPTEKYALPNIPEAFKNNAGITGKVFLKENRYIANTPKDVFILTAFLYNDNERIKRNMKVYQELLTNDDYLDVVFNEKTGGLKATHKQHSFDKNTGKYEKKVQEVGFKNGNSVILEIEDHTIYKQKSTDGIWNDNKMEIAGAETGTSSNIRNGLKHCASKKNTEVAILYFPNNNFSMEEFLRGLAKYNGLKNNPEQYLKFKKIICITDEGIVYEKSH